jgi:hypothetical protein
VKQPQKLLVISILLALASWVVPGLNLLTLPLQYLYTMLHEISHALASIATGGHGIRIEVFPNGSGVTWSYDGLLLFVAPAGYVGATVIGAIMLYLSKSAEGASLSLKALAISLAMAWIVWVRLDPIGLIICAVFGGLSWVLATKLKGDSLAVVGQFLGAFLCIASLQSVFAIFGFLSVPMHENDAAILEKATGIPAAVSAIVWSVLSLAAIGFGLHRAWKS